MAQGHLEALVLVSSPVDPCRWTCLVGLTIRLDTLRLKGRLCLYQYRKTTFFFLKSYVLFCRAQAGLNLPVPVGMFMNMAHIPPRFYNQHQQAMQARQQQQNPRGQNRRPPQRQKGNSPLLLMLVKIL